MAGAGFTFPFDYSEAAAAFERLRVLAANPTPLLEEIGVGLARNEADRFDRGEDPSGTPWVGLLGDRRRVGRT